MNRSAFKSGIERVLLSLGFARAGKTLVRHSLDVWTLLAIEKGFGNQWSINAGFWLDALGKICPERVEQTHLYFRLERLTPEFHEAIVRAGALDEPGQPAAYAAVLALLSGPIDANLRRLGTESGLREALASGRLSQGLVRKEARARLSS